MKRYFIFVVMLFLITVNMYALDYGIEASERIQIYNKEVQMNGVDISAFIGNTWLASFGEFVLHPQIKYNGELHINFEELSVHLYLGENVIEFGKYKNYFGQGEVYNFYYPSIPVFFGKNTKFWSFVYNLGLNNFGFQLGSLFDTERIDAYKTPQWITPYFKINYQNDKLDLSLLTDFFWCSEVQYISNRYLSSFREMLCKYDMKTAVEALYILPDEYNLYAQIGAYYNVENFDLDVNNLMFYLGCKKNFMLKNDVIIVPYFEAGIANKKFTFGTGGVISVASEWACSLNINYKQDDFLNIQAGISFETDGYEFSAKYTSENIYPQKKKSVFDKTNSLIFEFKFLQ